MTTSGHLWAIGYDDMTQAAAVRDKIVSLGWGKHSHHGPQDSQFLHSKLER